MINITQPMPSRNFQLETEENTANFRTLYGIQRGKLGAIKKVGVKEGSLVEMRTEAGPLSLGRVSRQEGWMGKVG